MRLHLVVLGVLPPLALAAGCAAIHPAQAAEAPADTPQGAGPKTAAPGSSGGPAVGGTAVIHPPAGIDPGMNKAPPDPAPEAGRMPVLKPPGTTGGNTTVVPK